MDKAIMDNKIKDFDNAMFEIRCAVDEGDAEKVNDMIHDMLWDIFGISVLDYFRK